MPYLLKLVSRILKYHITLTIINNIVYGVYITALTEQRFLIMTYHINVNEISMTSEERSTLLERRHSTWTTTGNLSEDSSIHIAREAYFSQSGMDIIEFTVVKGALVITRHPLQLRNCAYRIQEGELHWWTPILGGWSPCENASMMSTTSLPRGAFGDGSEIRTRTKVIAVRGRILNAVLGYGETPSDAWWKEVHGI